MMGRGMAIYRGGLDGRSYVHRSRGCHCEGVGRMRTPVT